MSKTSIPKNYHDLLGLYDTQRAIGIIKTIFQEKLCAALHLKRVTAPLFVLNGSGLNDDLNGVERPVSFDDPQRARKRLYPRPWHRLHHADRRPAEKRHPPRWPCP